MNKKIEFKLDESLFNEYKRICEVNGFDMSKRLRLFIQSEIPIKYDIIEVNDIIHEPSCEIDVVKIMGLNFAGTKISPKVFIIKSDDDISDNISFYYMGKKYSLDEVFVIKKEDDKILIECRKWKIEYIG